MTESAPVPKTAKLNASACHKARQLALQALYQWELSQADIQTIELQYLQDINIRKVDVALFRELLHQVPANLAQVEQQFQPFLDRPVRKLDPIELTTLRIASYELLFRHEVPFKVVINEALELNKRFGAEAAHKYINGVLGKTAQCCRGSELKS